MHKLASLNRQIKSAKEIFLPSVSSAAFYGRSVFTTLAVYNSTIFQWEKHWRRIGENASRLKIDLSDFSEVKVKESIYDLIFANDFQSGRVRVTFFDESANGLWSLGAEKKTSLLVTSADLRDVSGKLGLTVSPFLINSRSALVNMKSGNYLENILALEDCRNCGFDEAVRINEKQEIVSAIMANLFWVRGEKIYTSPLETGALQGTTREFVLENFSVVEKIITLDELYCADEIFLASAGLGIAKVKSFEKKVFCDFSVSAQVRKKFDDVITNLKPPVNIS
jgi:branched-subunit amino acid aminotransferase/4-amino-4-deoxychorismate lyase